MANFFDGGIRIVEDIRQLFGVAGGFCHLVDEAAINKWAKYKPVRHNAQGNITDAHRKSVDWGFGSINTYSSVSTMLSAVRGGVEGDAWTYLRPQGGVVGQYSSPYRPKDFIDYDHSARRPIGQITQSAWVKPSGNVSPLWLAFETGGYSEYSVNLKDFRNWSGWYLCLCIYNDSTQLYVTRCSVADDVTTAVSVEGLCEHGAVFGSLQFAVGAWNAFLFLSDRVIPTGPVFNTSGNYIPLAYTERDEFTLSELSISQAAIGISIESFTVDRNGVQSGSSRELYMAFIISNADVTPYNTGQITVEYMDSSGVVADTQILSSTSVPASGTYARGRSAYVLTSGATALSTASARLSFIINGVTFFQTISVTSDLPR